METMKKEHAKGMMLAYTNKVMADNGMTASDMEGIMSTIMIQLQSQSKLELLAEMNEYLAQKEGDKSDG